MYKKFVLETINSYSQILFYLRKLNWWIHLVKTWKKIRCCLWDLTFFTFFFLMRNLGENLKGLKICVRKKFSLISNFVWIISLIKQDNLVLTQHFFLYKIAPFFDLYFHSRKIYSLFINVSMNYNSGVS